MAGKASLLIQRHRVAVTLLAAMIWLLLVGSGMGMVIHYSNTPGAVGTIPASWPVASRIQPETSRPTLIMFAHPHCPCTRASLGELEQLMSDRQGRLGAQVWFVKPAGTVETWTNTDIWTKASAIPGVTVHCDDSGDEARRFHAETSGQTVLYDAAGHLLFQGGITLVRGHAGDNPGRSALAALLKSNVPDQIETPVFGCSLFEERCQKGDVVCKP